MAQPKRDPISTKPTLSRKKFPKKFETHLKLAKELVSKYGVSKTICVRRLQLPTNFFSDYEGTADAYNEALATFATDVLMKSVTDNLSLDSQGRKYLMNKLRVFDKEVELPHLTMKTPQDAKDNLAFAVSAYANKEISEEALTAIRSGCVAFSELVVATDLASELAELKAMFTERFQE